MRAVAMLALCVAVTGCDGPLSDLDKEFGHNANPSALPGKVLKTSMVALTSKRHPGAFSYRDQTLTVSVSMGFLNIEPSFPLSLLTPTLHIPQASISGCSRTCFGPNRWDADLLIDSTGTQVSLAESRDLLEWCQATGIPMISGKDKLLWMYGDGSLPKRNSESGSLAPSNDQTRSSCS